MGEEIPKVGISEISNPELGPNTGMGRISSLGIGGSWWIFQTQK